MITAYTNYDGSTDYLCVSTDVKPEAEENSLLYELDTKKMYYSKEGSWAEVGTDGGLS